MIFARPPDARSNPLAGRGDKVFAFIVFLPGKATAPGRILALDRRASVEDFDFVSGSLGDRFGKVNQIHVAISPELQISRLVFDFGDRQWFLQIDLHRRAFFQRLKTHHVGAVDRSRFRINFDSQTIVFQVPPFSLWRNRSSQSILLGKFLGGGVLSWIG